MNFDLRFCGRFALSQQLPYIVVIVMDWKMTPIRVFWPVLSFGKSLCVGGCNQPIIKVTQLLSCLCKNVKIANAVCRRQRWQRVYLTKKGLLCVCVCEKMRKCERLKAHCVQNAPCKSSFNRYFDPAIHYIYFMKNECNLGKTQLLKMAHIWWRFYEWNFVTHH